MKKEKKKTSWDLSYVYLSIEDWYKDLEKISVYLRLIEKYGSFDIISEQSDFVNLVLLSEKIEFKLSKLHFFLNLRNIDTTDEEINKMSYLVGEKSNLIEEKIIWLPHLFKRTGKERIFNWLKKNKALYRYIHYFDNFFRLSQYLLGEKEEKMLSIVSPSRDVIYSLYDELSVTDRKKKYIFINGKKNELTKTFYTHLLENTRPVEDQFLRKRAMKIANQHFIDYKNSFAKVYEGVVRCSIEEARIRGFKSYQDFYLNSDNINSSVLFILANIGRKYSYIPENYFKIKKKFLQLKKLFSSDLGIDIIRETKRKKYLIRDSKKEIQNALILLGKKYEKRLHVAMQDGRIDYYENIHKIDGAYSSSIYGFDPIILMNWTYNKSSLFTLAHEVGHSVNSLFINDYQSFPNHKISIVLAEVASIMNENLLFEYLYNKEKSEKEKLSLLQERIEDIIGTFFTQLWFSEYENEIHTFIQDRKFVGAKIMAETWLRKRREFLGEEVNLDKVFMHGWPRISHFFHSPYYVFKYAIALAVSFNFLDDLKRNGPEKYIDFLKIGSSIYPTDALSGFGISLKDDKMYDSMIFYLKKLINRFEALASKIFN